jgi:H+/Cl- antiporter ClcA
MPHFNDPTGPRRPADQLRRIARYHRWVIAVMIAQVTLWLGYLIVGFARDFDIHDGLRFPTIFSMILGGVAAVFIFLLYWTLRGPFSALIMGVAAIPPCIGILALLAASTTATAALRTSGIPVGLLGAADHDIPDDHLPYEFDEDEGW